MMGKKKREPRWVDVIVHRVGFRKSPRVLQLVMCWAIVEQDIGHAPTVDEYASWWGESRATAYRDLALFREATAGLFETPSVFIAEVGTELVVPVAPVYRAALA